MFEEVQKVAGNIPPVIGITTASGLCLMNWYLWETNPDRFVLVFFVLFAALILWIMLRARILTRVTPQGIRLRMVMGPLFYTQNYSAAEIRKAELCTVSRWNGYGSRRETNGWYWVAWGPQAVRVTFADGFRLTIGTAEPEKLRAAISASCL